MEVASIFKGASDKVSMQAGAPAFTDELPVRLGRPAPMARDSLKRIPNGTQFSAELDGHDRFQHLHQPAHGVTLLWERVGGDRWHKLRPGDAHIPAMLAAQAGQPDRFTTPNEFYAWRVVRQLCSLRAFYVDVDLADHQDAKSTLAMILDDVAMPGPSAAVLTGRGLHLYGFIEPVPASVLPVWQRVQETRS